jgi:glycosyltransferase involved in cell wall biosynthesis
LKILYIHQYFKTPEEGGAIRSWYISTAMVAAGHEVHMITSHNGKGYVRKNQRGVQVHYLPIRYMGSYGFYRRIIAFLNFSLGAYLKAKKLGEPDLMYVTSTPLTVGIVALLLKRLFRRPYVFEVRDLWPEVPVQMKIIRNPLIRLLTGKLERRIYAGASRIIALSPGTEQYIRNIHGIHSVHFCPNMSDCDFFSMNEMGAEEIREKYSLEGKFVIGYFGAIGRSNALGYLLDIALIAQEQGWNLAFLIIGEGPEKIDLIKYSENSGIKNLHFIEHQDKAGLRNYLSVIDAAYISFADYPVFQWNSPNKFFDALASGKMIISNVNGWIRELIETQHCGFYYHPEQPATFFSNLKPVMGDPHKLTAIKKNSRNLAEARFNRKILIEKLFSYLGI